MRFRLRTLLIAMAFLSLLFARVAYLKQTVAAHRRRVEELIREIASVEEVSIAQIQDEVLNLAEPGVRIRVLESPYGNPMLANQRGFGHIVSPYDTRQWREAIFHDVMAKRCESAMYHPWTLVSEADLR
jgi:hypothetical protein